MKALDSHRPLYAITPGNASDDPDSIINQLKLGFEVLGKLIGCVQFREKGDFPGRNQLATQLRDLCAKNSAMFIVNRDEELSRQVSADGIHTGKSGPFLLDLRSRHGDHLILGYSAHSVEEGLEAFQHGANYVFLSPIFSPLSKQDSRAPLGLSALHQFRAKSTSSVYALGGISEDNISKCLAAGATGVAGISWLFRKDQTTELLKRLKNPL